MRLYFDANAIIYGIEANPAFGAQVRSWVDRVEATDGGRTITSRPARLECRV